MASSKLQLATNGDRRYRDVKRLCLLFKGRINETVSEELIDELGGLQAAATFLMTGSHDAVRDRLNKSESYVKSLQEDSQNFTRVLENPLEDRQFSCKDCNKAWWKRVPIYKPVSRCFSCHRKFDCVPREHEWGVGEFECQCGNTFRGFGIRGRTRSMCHRCGWDVRIGEIEPPKKRETHDRRRKPLTHNCNGINCYRSNQYSPAGTDANFREKPPVCIHPHSSRTSEATKIHWYSSRHQSTGSTLCTFINQGSLDTLSRSPAPSLDTIAEED